MCMHHKNNVLAVDVLLSMDDGHVVIHSKLPCVLHNCERVNGSRQHVGPSTAQPTLKREGEESHTVSHTQSVCSTYLPSHLDVCTETLTAVSSCRRCVRRVRIFY